MKWNGPKKKKVKFWDDNDIGYDEEWVDEDWDDDEKREDNGEDWDDEDW